MSVVEACPFQGSQASERVGPKLLWRTSADVQVDLINLNSPSQSSPNQGSDGGSTPHNDSPQPPSVAGASPSRPGEKPKFKCPLCDIRFAQKQSVKRHRQQEHQPGAVKGCSQSGCGYKWKRKDEYVNHLEGTHGLVEDEITNIVGPFERRRCQGGVVESDPPPHSSPPPFTDCDQQSPAELQHCPQTPPLLAVGNDANHTSPPLMPPVAHTPRPGHLEPEITTTEYEDSDGLEHLAATHAPSAVLSEEEFALLVRHFRILIRESQIRLPSAHPGRSSTADIPPNPGMLHIPSFPSPVDGYHAVTHAPASSYSIEGTVPMIDYGLGIPSAHPGSPTAADPGMLDMPALPPAHTSPVSGNPPSSPCADAASTLTDASWYLGPYCD